MYGAAIRLIHKATGYFLVASNDMDEYGDVTPYNCVYLKKELSSQDELSSQWIICPRFRFRVEGDLVRANDFIVFKSTLYKKKQLTSVKLSPNIDKYDHVVGLNKDAFKKSGWQVKVEIYTYLL